mmetsp:Transcript_25859/g.75651  ORF Transcript_25859/g.75651 Transcript_25859/m.75651 type:complete len:162 (+) Transcript_25859:149-634(+)
MGGRSVALAALARAAGQLGGLGSPPTSSDLPAAMDIDSVDDVEEPFEHGDAAADAEQEGEEAEHESEDAEGNRQSGSPKLSMHSSSSARILSRNTLRTMIRPAAAPPSRPPSTTCTRTSVSTSSDDSVICRERGRRALARAAAGVGCCMLRPEGQRRRGGS